MGHPKQKPVTFSALHIPGSKRSYGTPGTIIAPAVTKKTTKPTRVVQPSWTGSSCLHPRRPGSPSPRKVRIVYGNRPYPRALPRSFFQKRALQYEPMDWDDCVVGEVVFVDLDDQIMEDLFESIPWKNTRSHVPDTDLMTTTHGAYGAPYSRPVEESDVEFMDLSAWEQSIAAIAVPPSNTGPRRVGFIDTVTEKATCSMAPSDTGPLRVSFVDTVTEKVVHTTIRPTEQPQVPPRSRRGFSGCRVGGLQPLAGMRRLDLGLTHLPPPPPDSDDETPTADDDGASLAGKRGRQLAQLETNGTRRKLAVSVISEKVGGVQPRPARSLTLNGGFTLGKRTSANW